MAAEEALKLFDYYWFEHRVFTSKQPSSSTPINKPLMETREELEESKIPHMPSLQIRSLSNRFFSSDVSLSFESSSPNSVILKPKLQKILSGKNMEMIGTSVKKKLVARRNKKGTTSSKSLSELEFEELKGFMDLGFVFSEEDKNSNLVSIVPGLQRIGRKANEEVSAEPVIPRPYLSEAWNFLDIKMANEPLIDWKVQDLHNEIDLKDNLRFWAQTVASAVKL